MFWLTLSAALTSLTFTPGSRAFTTDLAELGGAVTAKDTSQPLPSPVPITVKLYSGGLPIATAQADAAGRYAVAAPPGEYWLQVLASDQELWAERVSIGPGSWIRDLAVGLPGPALEPPAFAQR